MCLFQVFGRLDKARKSLESMVKRRLTLAKFISISFRDAYLKSRNMEATLAVYRDLVALGAKPYVVIPSTRLFNLKFTDYWSADLGLMVGAK